MSKHSPLLHECAMGANSWTMSTVSQLSRVLLLNSSSKHGGKKDVIVYSLKFKSIILWLKIFDNFFYKLFTTSLMTSNFDIELEIHLEVWRFSMAFIFYPINFHITKLPDCLHPNVKSCSEVSSLEPVFL